MSTVAGDEFGAALRDELLFLVASDDLAASVIARYHARRRVGFSCAAALGTVLAGLGVLLGLVSSTGHTSPAELRLSSYQLRLPDRYHVTNTSPAISAGSQQKVMAAVGSDGRCVSMQLTSPFRLRPSGLGPSGDPNVPQGAPEVAVGSYHAWLTQDGCGLRGPDHGLVFEMAAADGQIQDLMIESSGLSQAAFISLVSANLSS
jgi:hypothetical protein